MKTCRAILDPAITTVLVGTERRKFSIRKALLLDRSEYFRSAYNSQMKEALVDTFIFNNIDDDIFQAFMLWLYTVEIRVGAALDSLSELLKAEREAEEVDESVTSCDSDHRNDSTLSEEWYDDFGDGEEEDDDTTGDVAVEDMVFDSLTEKEWHRAIHTGHHFAGDPEQLDRYQLQTLLTLHENDDSYEAERPQWRGLLAEKASMIQGGEEEMITAALIDLYILADRFGARGLRVTLMDRLHQVHEQGLDSFDNAASFRLVSRAFENFPPSSPLRTWLVHAFASDWNPQDDNAEREQARRDLPKNFFTRCYGGYRLTQ